MKKNYQCPSIMFLEISQQRVIMASDLTDTLPYFLDDPLTPDHALSRRHNWEDDEDDEDDWW